MSGRVIPFLVVGFMLAGTFSSCKHDPVSPPPPPPPDTTKHTDTTRHPDTTHRVLHITPDSSSSVLHANIVFTLSVKPVPLPKLYTIAWIIDTAHLLRVRVDTVSFVFKDSGVHSIKAVYIDSTGSRRDSIATTIYIKDTTHKPINPNDTTSHDFVWAEYTNVQGQNNMTGCWVFDPNEIYALNDGIYRFNGTSWSKLSLNGMPNIGLSGSSFFGFTPNDFWVISGSIMFYWNGTTTEETRLEKTGVWHYPHDGVIHAAWGTSSSDMFFVGDSGTILHFDGTNWMKMMSGTTQGLSRVWGTSDHDIWTAGFDGDNGQSALLHYDGSQWTASNVNVLGEVDAVWTCDSTTSHHVAFACGGSVWRETDNGTWSLSSNSLPNDHVGLEQVTGNTANDVFCDGSFGMLLHWNGRSWYRYDQFYAPSGSRVLGAMSCKDNTVCAVGFKDGSSWVLIGQRK